jgi:methyl-accepting chemotaxis protein
MSISKRLSLLISLLILMVSFALGVLAIHVSTTIVEQDTNDWMQNEAEIGANLAASYIENYFKLLQVMADMQQVQTMDREIQKGVLFPYIAEMEVDDFAVIDMQGNAWHIKGGQTVNLSQRAYVQRALAGQRSISDIIPAAAGAVNTGFPLFNYVVPIRVNGRVVGALLARTNALVLSDIIKAIRTRGTGYAYICDLQGRTVAHGSRRDAAVNLQNPLEMAKKDPAVGPVAEAVQYILNTRHGSTVYFYNHKHMLCSFSPLPGFDMILVLSAEQESLMASVTFLRNLIIVIGVVFVGLGIMAAFFIARSIARPLADIRDALRHIGEGDLTRRVSVRGKDEIAHIGASLNHSTGNVCSLVQTIKEKTGSLLETGNKLAASMCQTAAAVNQIAANVENVKERVINQSASVTETNATMEQMSININNLSGHVEDQSAAVRQSSSSVEEMLTNIQNVAQTLVKNAENVEDLAKASDAGRSGLQEVASDIQEIARESEGLLEINAVMENIASQTNLLSMNAAIEAAHAGEAGKGFAVVADEIRKLAESSGEQSKTISGVLKKIKESIDKIRTSTSTVLDKFEAINKGVETVSQQEDRIRASMEEQNAESKQILDALGRLNDLTAQVKAGSDEMQEGSLQIIQESRNLGQASAEISGGMNEMANGAAQINMAVNQVNETSSENKRNIETLAVEIGKFRIE